MIVVLTPEQADFLRVAVQSSDGLLPPTPMNLGSQLHLNCLAAYTGLGGMRITAGGRNSVQYHDAKAG